ncbi:MAG: 16S rRNA (adenine(1518)-N(6)/adenine(1519)-N(6))-dimethyltransferase RsmA [Anaerolineales bacterium]|jgi:16S rRNA (adenine1518-N6/adenine1519-N6)-dimethyltransferase
MSDESLPPLKIPDLLRKFGLRPNKRLGQNFLVDETALKRVVDAANILKEDVILEVGAGVGNLTRLLARGANKVIAVEIDQNLLPPLRKVLSGFENVQIVYGDILALDLNRLITSSQYLVVANIPYYITSSLIQHLLEAENKPKRMVLTVQSEVGIRICAQPNDMSLLALSVQVYGEPHIVGRIPAEDFYPTPEVDSSIVHITLFPSPVIPSHHIERFFRLAKAGFSQKRKTLRNSISAGMGWQKSKTEKLLHTVGVDPKRRAETLHIEEWHAITEESYKLD